MSIRLETATGRGIDNHQLGQVTHQVIAWDAKMRRDFPTATPRGNIVSASYNCHGLTFASRRTWVYRSVSIAEIIGDDRYDIIGNIRDVLPGDVVVYYSNTGDPNHSGMVVEAAPDLVTPVIVSKWANAGEFVHALRDCPAIYGPQTTFYRCVR